MTRVDAPVDRNDRGLYVHFPYCAKKCPYCDFNSHAIEHDDVAYTDAVLSELGARATELGGPVGSIYFGGGTPSRWAPAQVARVIEAARSTFGLTDGAEITLEANPGTVAEERMFRFAEAGVNRFSVGTQSFDDRELVQLGRIHDAAASEIAVRIAKKTGARVSLDLIYALPGQSWNDVRRSLERALALEPEHISAYTLTIEPDTVLGRKTSLGLFHPLPDDLQAVLIERVTETLAAAGYGRYEISSYAKPGEISRHNSLYWVGGPYLGVGAGAHSYLPAPDLSRAVRRASVRRPDAYLADPRAAEEEEHLERRQVLRDLLMVGMRASWGMDLGTLPLTEAERQAVESALEPLRRRGLVARSGARWVPTPAGFLMNDGIARALIGALA